RPRRPRADARRPRACPRPAELAVRARQPRGGRRPHPRRRRDRQPRPRPRGEGHCPPLRRGGHASVGGTMAATHARAPVRFEPREDGVGVVSMRDASGKNAMSEPFVHALLAALRDAAAWAPLKVVVLAGTPEIFSSGADLSMLRELVHGGVQPTDIVLAKAVL